MADCRCPNCLVIGPRHRKMTDEERQRAIEDFMSKLSTEPLEEGIGFKRIPVRPPLYFDGAGR